METANASSHLFYLEIVVCQRFGSLFILSRLF